MNKQELIHLLNEIKNRQMKAEYDGEVYGKCDDDHEEADHLLLKYINDSEITEAFESIERWYS